MSIENYIWERQPGGTYKLVRRDGKGGRTAQEPKRISDSLGVSEHELEKFEADRRLHGHTGVRFVPDPISKGFFQLEYDSTEAFNAYIKHRLPGYYNKTNGGVRHTLSQPELQQAQTLARQRYPVNSVG